jgi:hypothetical protein
MGVQAAEPSDAEVDRQRRIAEMTGAHGPGWSDGFQPGSFGCHELLDRTNLLADTLEQYVLSHPACLGNREWYALADRALTALRELYQRVGAEMGDDGHESGDGSSNG